MKHLTKQEAIGRMMLAQATLIEENYYCRLVWSPSVERYELCIYLSGDDKQPKLQILQHPDFKSDKRNLKDMYSCISYTWNSETAPV